jgi:hypothetical protein
MDSMASVSNEGVIKKNIRWIELLAVIIPLIIWIGGLNITSMQTLVKHDDAITNIQAEIADQKAIQQKNDEKYDKIQADLTEIKLMLKDKADRK